MGASTSQAKKQLQLPCTASVSAKSQQTSAALQQQQQQQNQIIINPNSNSPIVTSNVGNPESSLLVDSDTNKISAVTNSSNIPIISSNVVVGNNGGSSKEPVELLEILEEQVSGYNSGDEHLGQKDTLISNEEWKRVSMI